MAVSGYGLMRQGQEEAGLSERVSGSLSYEHEVDRGKLTAVA